MRLPEKAPLPAEIMVCSWCLRSSCWRDLAKCAARAQGQPKRHSRLTAEQAEGYAFEPASFWKPPRAAGDPPRDVEELVDLVRYQSTRPGAARSQTALYLIEDLGIDAEQVEAAMAQAWPIEGAA